jgi:hypothetical protein
MILRPTARPRAIVLAASLTLIAGAPAFGQHREGTPAERAAVEARVQRLLSLDADDAPGARPEGDDGGDGDGDGDGGEVDVLAAGLASWRKADEFMGASCANCHAPDAFDLAFYNFSDEHVARRAAFHLPDEDVVNILALVHYVRGQYAITTPLDPMSDRALQPGGFLLPGQGRMGRDESFGKMLKGNLQVEDPAQQAVIDLNSFPLTIAERRINSVSLARQAREELMNLDIRALPIGMPVNRWSEDPFHGDTHAQFSDWVPDLPAKPVNGRKAQWLAAQDAYVADPSDEKFWALYWFTEAYCPQFDDSIGSQFMKTKYQSMMVAQHLLRRQAEGTQLWEMPGPVMFLDQQGHTPNGRIPNQFWELGDIAMLALIPGHGREESVEILGLPDFVNARLRDDWTAYEHCATIRAPWLWLGWTLDPGLQFSASSDGAVKYFSRFLWNDECYPIHNAFMVSKQWVSASCDERMFNPGTGANQQKLVPSLGKFTFEDLHINKEPAAGGHRNNYRRYVSNLFAMVLYTMLDDMNERNGVFDRVERKTLINEAERYFNHVGETSSSSYMRLVRDVRARMAQLPNL